MTRQPRAQILHSRRRFALSNKSRRRAAMANTGASARSAVPRPIANTMHRRQRRAIPPASLRPSCWTIVGASFTLPISDASSAVSVGRCDEGQTSKTSPCASRSRIHSSAGAGATHRRTADGPNGTHPQNDPGPFVEHQRRDRRDEDSQNVPALDGRKQRRCDQHHPVMVGPSSFTGYEPPVARGKVLSASAKSCSPKSGHSLSTNSSSAYAACQSRKLDSRTSPDVRISKSSSGRSAV